MLSLEGKRVVVVGLGASGVAAARLCARRRARVVATDRKPLEALGEDARALEGAGVTLSVGGHERAGILEADLVVVSPGVPSFAELDEAERRGANVVGRGGARYAGAPAPRADRRRRGDEREEHDDVARRGAPRSARAAHVHRGQPRRAARESRGRALRRDRARGIELPDGAGSTNSGRRRRSCST